MIKKKGKTQKDLAKQLHAVRDKINKDIQHMPIEKEIKYLEKVSAQREYITDFG